MGRGQSYGNEHGGQMMQEQDKNSDRYCGDGVGWGQILWRVLEIGINFRPVQLCSARPEVKPSIS